MGRKRYHLFLRVDDWTNKIIPFFRCEFSKNLCHCCLLGIDNRRA
uniref:Uncharacterized protein n=1 Tax=Arsenophonus nasoniae TaxID=638 RepID=D2TXZ0_9GAMM|nr:hypothetical protein ARN_09900 [Arsenophonus nasoniae]